MLALIKAIHAVVMGQWGPTASQLQDFGFTLAKAPVPRSTAAKASSANTGMRSRGLLGTRGPKQKKAFLAAAKAEAAAQAAAESLSTSPTALATEATGTSSKPPAAVVPATPKPGSGS